MANGQGFMIPVNEADWINGGVRNNWCAAPNAWWGNENVYLANSTWGKTDAGVDDTVTITVGIQGLIDPDETSNNAIVTGVQAWACLPSPTAGYAGTIVPSMVAEGPPVWSSAQGVSILPSSNPSEYQATAGITPPFRSIQVGTWTPRASDIVAPNTTTHCCLFANCWGFSDATGPVNNPGGNPVGAQIPADLAGIDVCTSIYQGQCNITIVPVTGPPHEPHPVRFGFVAVNPGLRGRTEVVVEVTPVAQERGLDPAVRRALEGGPFRDLALQPAASQPVALRLRDNDHQQEGRLAEVLHKAETLVEEPIKNLTHPFPDSGRLRLGLPVQAVHPLVCEVDVDPKLPPGSVHVFDITQTDPGGRRGGIRLATVVAPGE